VPTAAELTIVLEAQDRASAQLAALGRDVQRLEGQVEGASRSFGGLGGVIGRLGQVGLAAGGVGAIVEGFRGATDAVGGLVAQASDLNEQVNRTGAVFGTAADQVIAFSRTTSQALGITQNDALEAAGNFGQLFQTAGLSSDAAADMSTTMVRLAADIASFNNLRPEDALEKLRSGLVGESEPLRTVGVLLSEEAVKAEAFRLGLARSTADLTEAVKVQARYSLILQQTGAAQGDFARTSTGLANAQRIIRASFVDIQSTLGQAFLPTVARAASFLAQELPRALEAARVVAAELAPALQAVADAASTLAPVLAAAFSGDFQGALQAVVPLVTAAGARLGPALAQWGQAFLDWVQQVGPPLLERLRDLGGQVFDWIEAQAPPFLERLVGEWVPAFVLWVAAVLPPLLVQLEGLLAGIGDWVVNTAVPRMVRLGGELGEALLRGLGEALQRLGPVMGEALDTALREHPLIPLLLSAAPGASILSPEVRAQIAGAAPVALPAVSGAAGAAAAAGAVPRAITINVGGVDVAVPFDPMAAARQVGDVVTQQVFAALAAAAAGTDPGASPRVQGAPR